MSNFIKPLVWSKTPQGWKTILVNGEVREVQDNGLPGRLSGPNSMQAIKTQKEHENCLNQWIQLPLAA